METPMKRLLMALAIAAAANLASAGVQPASANPAHHPAKVTKGKKASPAKKIEKVKTSRTSMQCPMMKGHSMMHTKMHHGHMMKCPMMRTSKGHKMGATQKH
jgi:hypothetical protein